MPFERVTASKSTCPDLIQTNSKSSNRGLNSGTLGNDSKNPAEITGGKYCNPNSRCELRSPRVTHGTRSIYGYLFARRRPASQMYRLIFSLDSATRATSNVRTKAYLFKIRSTTSFIGDSENYCISIIAVHHFGFQESRRLLLGREQRAYFGRLRTLIFTASRLPSSWKSTPTFSSTVVADHARLDSVAAGQRHWR